MMKRGVRISSAATQISTRGGLQVTVPASDTPAASSAFVSGAGSLEANGTYTPRGTENGKTYYNLEGQPDDPFISAIFWDGGSWFIYLSNGTEGYIGREDTPVPWDVVGEWSPRDGEEPSPFVMEA